MSLKRLKKISDDLRPNNCIGEAENREIPIKQAFITRYAVKIAFVDNSAKDERYGGSGDVAILEGELMKIPGTNSSTVLIFMHPSGIQNLLPLPNALARAGLHVCTCSSRYPNNDTCLIMEKVLLDLSACIKHLRDKYGYKKVVLCGWSGGGSLSAFYAAQSELSPGDRIKRTPAGDTVDLSTLEQIDGLFLLAAHSSRAKIFTEWIDPAVTLESFETSQPQYLDFYNRDSEIDIYNEKTVNQFLTKKNTLCFTKDFENKFRKAQVERNRKITQHCLTRVKQLDSPKSKLKTRDEGFVVHCTQADLRRIDSLISPNGREKVTAHNLEQKKNELWQENVSPVGLARFTTCRAFLSQWSYDLSNADAVSSLNTLAKLKSRLPVLVLENEADHLVPRDHLQEMFEALGDNYTARKYVRIANASHYYFGQKQEMLTAVKNIQKSLRDFNLI
eukprot:snap_masked-scaffold_1-processed-gene-21.30-mRNA-1 protein AED:0.03 eAED:0.07 QI:0/-1/0/1/-1/1/1/0/446